MWEPPDETTMKTILIAALLSMVAVPAAAADAGWALLQKSGCTACHALDKKIVGPAYVDVAAKYRGDPSAPAKLAAKIKTGGAGVWGPVAMPPNTMVSDADIKTLVAYILSLKK